MLIAVSSLLNESFNETGVLPILWTSYCNVPVMQYVNHKLATGDELIAVAGFMLY